VPEAVQTTSVCIADDHPVFRHGLRKLLELDDGFKVIGEAEDGRSAIECVRRLHPDVLLLDIAMPTLGGLEALPELTAAGPNTRVLLVTAGIGRVDLLHALQLGARGVVLKEAATRLVGQAVRAVAAGSYWVGPEAVSDLVGAIKHLTESPADRRFGLTPRELEIVTAVVAGQSNREIATQLAIREQTVKHHLTSIFDKVGVSTRLELALFALKHKLAGDLS
jgi:DNA-binding NarL/FixJ family response regulator